MPDRRFWIVTPSFNSLRWLPCAVASVADQACGGAEVHHHVQDGGSKDGTREWLMAYAQQCAATPRAGYTFSFESAPDAGMYDAINKGWARAPQGFDFFGHLNSDEQYLPGALETVAQAFAQNPAWEVLLADMIVTDAGGRYLCHRRSLEPSPWVFRLTTGGMTACTFQRACVFQERGIRFDPQWRIIADKVWYHTLAQSGVALGCHHRLLSAFTETGDNLGWSGAVHEESQRYADRFLGGTMRGVYLCSKWNGLRRFLKELFLESPKSYALYTPESLPLRKTFPIVKPRIAWRKKVLPIPMNLRSGAS